MGSLPRKEEANIDIDLLLICVRNHYALLPYTLIQIFGVVSLYFLMYGVPSTVHALLSGLMLLFSAGAFTKYILIQKTIIRRSSGRNVRSAMIGREKIMQLIAYKSLALVFFLIPVFNCFYAETFYNQSLGFAISALLLVIFSSVSSSYLPLFMAELFAVSSVSVLNAMLLESRESNLLILSMLITACMAALIGIRNWSTSKNLLLQKRDLQEAVKAADMSQQAKSDFIATLSHEIRTPLNGIMGMIHFLKEAPLRKEERDSIDVICRCSEALLNTLNDVLDMSKMEAGKLSIDCINFEVGNFLQDIHKLMESRAQEKNIELILNTDPHIDKYIHGDPHRIQQVLINLVNNAIKFTAKGSVTINVYKKTEENHPLLRFEVIDTGPGISLKTQQKLFRSYVQADSSTSRNYGGTGLGLSIAKRLTELMDGSIGVHSVTGDGSTFWFEIPYLSAVQNNAGNVEEENVVAFSGKGYKILVAEDNHVNQMVIRKLLEKYYFEYDIVQNGVDALKWAAEKDYHIILMDMQMPEMDGLEATIRLKKAAGRNYRTPVIGLTGNIMKEHIDDCLRAGMVDHVAKPIDLNLLIKKMISYLPEEKRGTAHKGMILPKTGMLAELRSIMGEDYVLEFVAEANRNIVNLVRVLSEAHSNREITLMAQYAHDLKSVSGSIDRFDIYDMAQRLEKLCRNKNQDSHVANHIQKLIAEIRIATGVDTGKRDALADFPLALVKI